jgi:hypothetical protein
MGNGSFYSKSSAHYSTVACLWGKSAPLDPSLQYMTYIRVRLPILHCASVSTGGLALTPGYCVTVRICASQFVSSARFPSPEARFGFLVRQLDACATVSVPDYTSRRGQRYRKGGWAGCAPGRGQRGPKSPTGRSHTLSMSLINSNGWLLLTQAGDVPSISMGTRQREWAEAHQGDWKSESSKRALSNSRQAGGCLPGSRLSAHR